MGSLLESKLFHMRLEADIQFDWVKVDGPYLRHGGCVTQIFIKLKRNRTGPGDPERVG